MSALADALNSFAGAIVLGQAPSTQIDASYGHYSAAVAVEVYRNNYRGNLHDALAGAYPVIEQLVGEEFFRLLSSQYIGQHPSRSGNLHGYGAEMATWVAGFAPAQGLPYLADIAALEWACHRAYFAGDAAVLDLSRLAQVLPDQYSGLVLHFHPACHLVRSRHPIAAIWHAHQPGAPSEFHIDLDSGPGDVLVSRKQDVVGVSELSAAAAEWLHGLQAGTPLGEATAATLLQYPDFDLQAALLNLVAQQALCDFCLKELS